MSFRLFSPASRWALPATFVAGLAVAALAFNSGSGVSASTPAARPALSTTPSVSYADAVERAAPAVVTIQVEKRVADSEMPNFPDDSFFQRFFGQQFAPEQPGPTGRGQNGPRRQLPQLQAPVERGVGSGVIMTADGTIITNNHVVDGASHVVVVLPDGREFTGKVVGTDAATDVAVVHIDAKNLPTLTVADSDRARVGDVVLAVGNPLNVGETVTMGIISAKGRTTDLGGDSAYEDFIQTDAPINRGNSGGALITTNGELIGINTQIMSPSGGSIGIGFAIPSDMAEHVMTELVTKGHVDRGLLGVTVQNVTADMAQSLGLAAAKGAIVNSVNAGSAASKAGLVQGDVILKLDGQPIDGSNDLRNRIGALTPGASVTLDVWRDGKEQQLHASLGEMTANAASTSKGASESSGRLGMTLESVTPSLAQQYQLPRGTTGVAVTGVDAAGGAARAGLQPGDVIRQVNGQAVHTPDEVTGAVSRRTDRPSMLLVERNGQAFYVAVR